LLNPEFRWLDPEPEHLERLSHMANPVGNGATPWQTIWAQTEPALQAQWARRVAARLASPGSHPQREIQAAVRTAGNELGLDFPDSSTFGWPDRLLASLFAGLPQPSVWLLGVLDADGIWAGCIAGLARNGLDFLTTFQNLWADEPALAARQKPGDVHDHCLAAATRFARPAGGLFIYRNEFFGWRDSGWRSETLQWFLGQGTAVQHWP
jgi:hypothetical protein